MWHINLCTGSWKNMQLVIRDPNYLPNLSSITLHTLQRSFWRRKDCLVVLMWHFLGDYFTEKQFNKQSGAILLDERYLCIVTLYKTQTSVFYVRHFDSLSHSKGILDANKKIGGYCGIFSLIFNIPSCRHHIIHWIKKSYVKVWRYRSG